MSLPHKRNFFWKSKRGFTLIEMVIVSAIVGVIMIVGGMNVVTQRDKKQLEAALNNARTYIAAAQNKSIAIQDQGAYAVDFVGNTIITVWNNPSMSSPEDYIPHVESATFTLPQGISFANYYQGNPLENANPPTWSDQHRIIFAKRTGRVNNPPGETSPLYIRLESNRFEGYIGIDPSGNIQTTTVDPK